MEVRREGPEKPDPRNLRRLLGFRRERRCEKAESQRQDQRKTCEIQGATYLHIRASTEDADASVAERVLERYMAPSTCQERAGSAHS
jgi:hypothetical protein